MGFENFFGKKKQDNKNEEKESLFSRLERERKRYSENVNSLKETVKRKGGWGKIFGEKIKQGYDFYAKEVAPYVSVGAATITLALIVSGAPVMAWMPYSMINTGNYLIHKGWEDRHRKAEQATA